MTIERSWKTGLSLLNTGGVVVIKNCLFLSNGFNNQPKTIKSISNDFHEKGGGMQVIIGNRQTGIAYTIKDCTFQNNSATEGGGLFLIIHEGAQQNSVNIENTIFEKKQM